MQNFQSDSGADGFEQTFSPNSSPAELLHSVMPSVYITRDAAGANLLAIGEAQPARGALIITEEESRVAALVRALLRRPGSLT